MPEDEMIERRMLKALNIQFRTGFRYDQFMEWSSYPIQVDNGERVFKLKGEYNGIYVAIKL